MPQFLHLLPPSEALALLIRSLPASSPRAEQVDTAQALGRVTASPVTAPEPLPAFPRSTVDGYAVRARDTFGAGDTLPVYLVQAGEVPMGSAPGFALGAGQAALIHTGGMLPEGADAVVMVEHTQAARPGEVEVLRAVAPGENQLRAGEDVAAGQVVLEQGVSLGPAEIGGLMALGLTRVSVVLPPRVAILSSGDEVIDPHQAAQPGQVRDVNSYTLSALVEKHGGFPVRFGILPDRRAALEQALRRALAECDVVVITAGSSASTRDLTAEVIDAMGPPGVLVHGVSVKPGKPTILAVCPGLPGEPAVPENQPYPGKPVVGLPGNPVSALVIAGLFVVPVIERLLGIPPGRPQPSIIARLSVNLPSQAGREDWIPVKLSRQTAGWCADPIFYKSNLIFTLAQADGLLHIPPDATGLEVGAEVEVELL
jgi:molybdopterin molybdotransferase